MKRNSGEVAERVLIENLKTGLEHTTTSERAHMAAGISTEYPYIGKSTYYQIDFHIRALD
jgi:hypothetical protein